MRTNVDLDDALLQEAMQVTGEKTKKGAIEASLRDTVKRARQRQALENLIGIGWEGDLDEMRNDWTPETDWGLVDRR